MSYGREGAQAVADALKDCPDLETLK